MLLSTTADRLASPIQVRRVAHQPCMKSRPGARPHAAYALTNTPPTQRCPIPRDRHLKTASYKIPAHSQLSRPPSNPPILSWNLSCCIWDAACCHRQPQLPLGNPQWLFVEGSGLAITIHINGLVRTATPLQSPRPLVATVRTS